MSLSLSQKLGWVSLSVMTSSAVLAADPATQPDVDERINALQAQINELRSQQSAQRALTQQITAQNVLDDAQRHTQFFEAQGVLAGYTEGHFLLRSDDGHFLAHPWLQFQFRNTTDYRQDVLRKGTADDTQNGFEVRRLKFGVDGNLFGQELTYMFQFAVDRHNGNVGLEMAWARYRFDNTPFGIRAGQFKDPLDHEQLTASRYFPAADRSLVNDVFINGEGFIKGASFIYDPGTFVRGEAAFTGGLRNFNTNFQQYPSGTGPSDWGAAARVEFKPFGSWKDYELMTAYGLHRDTLVFGGGVDYTETGHSDALVHVADAQYQNAAGLSLYAAYLGRYTIHGGAKMVDTYDPTVRVQASWALGRHWEPYARYEYIHFDGREFTAHTQSNVHVITGGVNYYLFGPSAKLTLDVSYLPQGSPVNDDGFGILADNGHNEVVARAQFQLVL